MRRLTYLACPYSHPDPAVRAARFEAANRASVRLLRAGHIVFSPISHTHPITLAGDLPGDWAFWQRFDRAYLEASALLVVLTLPGWLESTGVTAERQIAAEARIDEVLIADDWGAVPIAPLPDLTPERVVALVRPLLQHIDAAEGASCVEAADAAAERQEFWIRAIRALVEAPPRVRTSTDLRMTAVSGSLEAVRP